MLSSSKPEFLSCSIKKGASSDFNDSTSNKWIIPKIRDNGALTT
jgi:hypothetical protein